MDSQSDYLLDNNIISILLRPKDALHKLIMERFEVLKTRNSRVFLPVIAIAEIESGMAKAINIDPDQRDALRKFFRDHPLHLGIDDDTIEPYALIRGQIWRDYGTPKKSGRGHVEKLPEELLERVSGKSLGIDERDLLIAATAAQYRLILITNDSNEGMKRIKAAAEKLEADGQPVRLLIQFWP